MDDQTATTQKPVSQPSGNIVPQPPAAPVGSTHKEAGPVPSVETGNYLSPTEVEPALHPEVKEAGVKVVEKPEVKLHDKKIGMMPAKESTPVSTAPSGMVSMPMTPQEAITTVKKEKNVAKSVLWRAYLLLRQLKMKNQ